MLVASRFGELRWRGSLLEVPDLVERRFMQAIDLYSGVGGWSLGLRLAGLEVLASYERSLAANETNRRNNGHVVVQADLRSFDLNCLPEGVSAVVGSPPCTQFSYSNRGGCGDLSDGLEDVKQFLRIVDHIRPAVWAMENVPRLAGILSAELTPKGALAEFCHLELQHEVFDMQEFGLPQKRLRCIVGNFNFELLKSYRSRTLRRTLGSVVASLRRHPFVDPVFDEETPCDTLVDHHAEDPLDSEQERINRCLKELHPIYNRMQFPDSLDRPSRTITATCTRVSRESIIIPSPEANGLFRRLTVRERACCQGFPISFQFHARNYGEKLQMVGNAIPPLFAYYVAHAMLGTSKEDLAPPAVTRETIQDTSSAIEFPPDKRVLRYREDRTFQFAVPSLRLKTGVRFELVNKGTQRQLDWHIKFVFGTSKSIQVLRPSRLHTDIALSFLPPEQIVTANALLSRLRADLSAVDFLHLQAVWSHRGPGATRPFMLLDLIDGHGKALQNALNGETCAAALRSIASDHADQFASNLYTKKLAAHASAVIAGLLIAGATNDWIEQANPSTQREQNPLPAKKAV